MGACAGPDGPALDSMAEDGGGRGGRGVLEGDACDEEGVREVREDQGGGRAVACFGRGCARAVEGGLLAVRASGEVHDGVCGVRDGACLDKERGWDDPGRVDQARGAGVGL